MKRKGKDLSYLEHLEELRYRIIFCLIFFFITLILSFLNSKNIIFFLQKPLTNTIDFKLYFLKPYEKIVGYFNISLFFSLIITLPVIFFQIMIFIYPALTGKERIIFWFLFILMPIFFILSLIFSYYILLPLSYNFFLKFSQDDGIKPMISFLSHINTIITILLSTTLLFQLPFVLLVFIIIGIIKIEFLKRIRKYVIVLIFTISALVTPPDVFSQILLAIPLYLLFEFTILVGNIILKFKEFIWKEESL